MHTATKYIFLINPTSGNGNSTKIWDKLKTYLEAQQVNYSAYYSTSLQDFCTHFQKLAQQKSSHQLVILGGDGTLYAALNCLHFPTNLAIPLAYIPCGSGNDFAKAAKIATDPLQALKHLLESPIEKKLALGYYQYPKKEGVFSNNFGLGFDARIVTLANNSAIKRSLNKFHLGKFSYATLFFKALWQQKNFEITVELPHQKPKKIKHAFLCTITNQPYFGGGFAVAPTADLAEKKLDLVVLENINWLKFIWLFLLLILPGKLWFKPKSLQHFKATHFKIHTTTAQPVQINGETLQLEPTTLNFQVVTQKFIF